MKKLIALLLVSGMMLALLVGCTPTTGPSGDGPAADEPYGVFRTYITGEIETLNPHTWASSNAGSAIGLASMYLYQALPAADLKSFVLEGQLADGDPVQTDEDGREWKIPIRQGTKWENGYAINVDDVIYSYKMCLDPILVNSRASQLAADYIIIKNATDYYLQGDSNTVAWEDVGIKKIDDFTLGLELVDPVTKDEIKSHFNYTWTCIVHEPTYEALMNADRTITAYGSDKDKFVSCGRFLLTDWVNGSVINYVRNPDYYDDSIKLEGYQYKMLADSNTALELFLNDELDVVNLNATVIEQYADDPRIKTSPSTYIQTITINHQNTDNNGILGNLNFRKALYYAVNREAIARLTNGIPAHYLVPSKCLGENGSFRDMEIAQTYLPDNYGYDTKLAKEYYDKALAEVGLDTLTLSISYSETSVNTKAAAEFLHKELPGIFGDSFELKLIAGSSSVLTAYVQGWRSGDVNSYGLTFRGWNTSTAAPWNGLKVYSSSYSNKNEPYFNPEFDALWELANNTIEAKLDPAYRLQLTADMEKMALEDVVAVPIHEAPSYLLINERVNLVTEDYIPGYGYGYTLATISR